VRLKAGDTVVVEVEKVGRLENHCVAGSGETRIA
jgi:2-keto-4-pentenoate hydratase/2-oxohepta-3-ene-1,7-dioic acid hydratase in catechol pathway